MDMYEKFDIEKLINNPNECDYRVLLREFFEYQIPLKCPYKAMLKAFYDDRKERELKKDQGF